MSNEMNLAGQGIIGIQGISGSTVNVTQIIAKSGEFRELEERLGELQKLFDRTPVTETQERLELSEKIGKQKAFIESFKQDVLKLAETFDKIELNTERLQKAKEHFDKGEITEARVLLEDAEEERSSFVTRALDKQKEYKKKILPGLQDAASEYLILAQTTALDFENLNRFEDTCRNYEQSIAALPFAENLFNYAYFLSNHNQFHLAGQYYKRILDDFNNELPTESRIRILVNLASVQTNRNEFDEAEKNYQAALENRRDQARENPETYLPDVALTLNNLAVLHWNRNEFEAAEAEYTEALEIRRGLAEKNPQAYLPDVAMTLNNLAILHRARNEFEAAEAGYTEGLEAYRELAEKNPQAYLPDVAATLNNLANLHWNRNEFEAAEAEYMEALAAYRELAEKNPQAYLPYVALTLNNLALLHRALNEFEAAEAEYGEALAAYRELAEKNPQAYLPKVAMTLINFAMFYREAKPDRKRSVEMALEVIKILLPFIEYIPVTQKYTAAAFGVLKDWGMSEEEIMAALSADSGE